MARYSVIAPSSIAAAMALRSSSRAGFSVSPAALYSRSFRVRVSTSEAAC